MEFTLNVYEHFILKNDARTVMLYNVVNLKLDIIAIIILTSIDFKVNKIHLSQVKFSQTASTITISK